MNVSYHGQGANYSEAVVVDDRIYLSGLVCEDLETGELKLGTIEEETELVMQNMKTILEKYGSSMDKLIRVEIFMTDFSERVRMNQVYASHFDPARIPSRVCVGCTDLYEGCRVEMLAIAYR